MPSAIAALLGSRKFIIVTLALIVCTILVCMKLIPASSLMTYVGGLTAVLVAAIGAEDFATKWGTVPNSTTTTTIAKTAAIDVVVTDKVSEKVAS